MSHQCPICSWFLSNVYCVKTVNGDIVEVFGTCKRCGVVQPTDWIYDQFGPQYPVEGDD